MSIARIVLPVAAFATFDYWIPEGLAVGPGTAVHVKLSGRNRVGVVVGLESTSEYSERLLPIDEVIEGVQLSDEIVALASFVSRYYQCALGMAFELAIPPLARARVGMRSRAKRGRSLPDATTSGTEGAPDGPPVEPAPSRALNAAQRDAVDAIVGARDSFATFVLFGVTGSGKTEVYLNAAREAVARGGQVLILVPEINLTPQFQERVRAALPQVQAVTLHSALPAGARRANWEAAATGAAAVVLGTRLAVFTPLPHLALVVVDEEHDDSFKQQDGVRYHARDLALWRARRRGVPIVLGSATPSMETWRRARSGRARLLTLASRAVWAMVTVVAFGVIDSSSRSPSRLDRSAA